MCKNLLRLRKSKLLSRSIFSVRKNGMSGKRQTAIEINQCINESTVFKTSLYLLSLQGPAKFDVVVFLQYSL